MATPAIETINRGAIIDKFHIAGQNILLGFPHPSLYDTIPHPHFGQTIGRTTNRIDGAILRNLNGRDYTLFANNGPNNLHGGKVGWGARQWTGPTYVRRGQWDEGVEAVRPKGWKDEGVKGEGREGWGYELLSEDGEEGFPGAVVANVWYFEGRGKKGVVVLDAEYEIRWQDTQQGEATETVVGITNHAYFNLNLAQQKSLLTKHTLTLPTATYQTLRPGSMGIPDGAFTAHPEVPAEPNTPFSLGTSSGDVRPIDDCFVLNTDPSSIPLDTRPNKLQTLATLHGDLSGLNLIVQSTEPAYQIYTGGGIDVPAWEKGEKDGQSWEGGEGFTKGSGLCVEPSRYVDAAGREEWRKMCLLKKGDLFGQRTRYWGWKD